MRHAPTHFLLLTESGCRVFAAGSPLFPVTGGGMLCHFCNAKKITVAQGPEVSHCIRAGLVWVVMITYRSAPRPWWIPNKQCSDRQLFHSELAKGGLSAPLKSTVYQYFRVSCASFNIYYCLILLYYSTIILVCIKCPPPPPIFYS